MGLTREQEAMALRFDVFAGDKDGGGWCLLRDEFVTALKVGPCATPCGGRVHPGQRARKMVAVMDGKVSTIRFCEPCCAAMALDEPEEFYRRTDAGLRASHEATDRETR